MLFLWPFGPSRGLFDSIQETFFAKIKPQNGIFG
jgi:hypothetical protein